MKALPRSQAARRRAAAAVAVASVGAGILGTQSAEAEIVSIDLTNVNGKNFTGVNAGVSYGSQKTFGVSFPGAGQLEFNVANQQSRYRYTGPQTFPSLPGYSFFYGGIANGGSDTTPTQFALGDTISGPASAFAPGYYGNNTLFKYVYNGTHQAPNFDGYLGFLSSGSDGNGTDGVYGWIKATWDGTDFQFYSAAYESTPGVAILAGALPPPPSPVPEIDPSGLASTMSLVIGSVAMLEQRRRKRAVAAATAAVSA